MYDQEPDRYEAIAEWYALLKECRPEDTNPPNKMIVCNRYFTYVVPSDTTLDRDSAKLCVRRITQISCLRVFFATSSEQLSNDIQSNNVLKVDGFLAQAKEIIDMTESMIQAELSIRNQPLKKIGRGIALTLSALSSVAVIGIPFLIRQVQEEVTFNAEMKMLFDEIRSTRERLKRVRERQFEQEELNLNFRQYAMRLLTRDFRYDNEVANHLLGINDIRRIVEALYDRRVSQDVAFIKKLKKRLSTELSEVE